MTLPHHRMYSAGFADKEGCHAGVAITVHKSVPEKAMREVTTPLNREIQGRALMCRIRISNVVDVAFFVLYHPPGLDGKRHKKSAAVSGWFLAAPEWSWGPTRTAESE